MPLRAAGMVLLELKVIMIRQKVIGNLNRRPVKKYYFFIILASLLVCSCSEEVAPLEQEHAREVILSVEVSDSESKSAVDSNGGFVWTNGDKISVWAQNETKGAFQTFKLNSGAGTTSATFRGIVVGEDMELCKCAIYPAGAHKLNGNSLSVNMPDVYNIGSNLSNTNSPMIAMLGYGETISFGHMAGLMTFSFKNVPAGVCSFVLTAADKDITGYFNVDLEGGLATIEAAPLTSKNTVTVNFAPLDQRQDITISVPMPIGTYNGMSYQLLDETGNVVTESSTKATNVVARKKQIVMPSVKFHPSYGVPETLSSNGYANCYVVPKAGYYNFKAKIAGAILDGFHTKTLEIKPKSAKFLWDDVSGSDVISNVEFIDGYVTFETTGIEGNAVIAVYDNEDPSASEATILWSWHIWCTDTPGVVTLTSSNGANYDVMDRNLGALSADPADGAQTSGLVYQWGRKDPFTITHHGASHLSLVSQSLLYSVQHPEIYLKGYDWTTETNNELWGAIVTDGTTQYVKTIYDPCPAGYMVPPKDSMTGLTLSKVSGDFNKGYLFNIDGASLWIPSPGYLQMNGWVRGNPDLDDADQSHFGYYWHSDPHVNVEKDYLGGYYMKIAENEVKPARNSSQKDRAFGRSIRCVRY